MLGPAESTRPVLQQEDRDSVMERWKSKPLTLLREERPTIANCWCERKGTRVNVWIILDP